jgi:hypothetical protein
MAEVAGTLFKHRERLNEMATVLASHGLAAWAERGGGIATAGLVDAVVHRVLTPEEMEASTGERRRDAPTQAPHRPLGVRRVGAPPHDPSVWSGDAKGHASNTGEKQAPAVPGSSQRGEANAIGSQ